jgi:crotonobetainyl-CoA:carnitine CoA-transferase CaiB-like acyl-CoA transferase
MNYLVSGEVPQRLGTGHPNLVPYQAFETRDGYIVLAVGNDRQFRACVQCLGCGDLADLPPFSTNAARVANRHELVAILSECLARRTTSEWLEELRRQRVPAGPINDLAAVFSGDEAIDARLVRQMSHAAAEAVPTIANPVRFSATPVEYRTAPPLLGQHTDAVLRDELGYSDEEISGLRDSGAI